ncbi:cytochrome P450 [Kitasatospora purpeofusca]|uniref:cytochrome P450 n=1 Tax=Kitasatospora purpeofusca TaxID=67352 RepID=UPI00380B53A0
MKKTEDEVSAPVRPTTEPSRSTYTVRTAPGAWPLLGHLPRLLRDPLAFLRSLPAHGDLTWVRIGPWRALVVCDPALTRRALVDDRAFDKGGAFYDRVREVVRDGVLTCPHSDHRRQRRLVQPAFHPTRQPGYARVMAEHIEALTGSWYDGQEIDVLKEMQTLTARIAAATMFGASLNAATIDTVIEDLAVVVPGVARRLLMPPLMDRIPTPGNLRYDRARRRLRDTVRQAVLDSRATRTGENDLMSMLTTMHGTASPPAADHEPQDAAPSDTELVDQAVTLFLAGAETLATAMAWALHLLAEHPDILERTRTEVDTALAGRTTAVHEDLPGLRLTGRVITEALRLRPPLWMATRTTPAEAELGGHRIPPGTNVVWSPYLLHHRADLFPDPTAFDPDRWDPRHPTPPPRGACIPFGEGPRKCLADTFAVTEATLTLATVAARWNLHPVPGTKVSANPRATLTPHPLRLRVTART